MGLEVLLSFNRCIAVFHFPLNILQKFVLKLYLKAWEVSPSYPFWLSSFWNTNTDFCIYCWVTRESITTHKLLENIVEEVNIQEYD